MSSFILATCGLQSCTRQALFRTGREKVNRHPRPGQTRPMSTGCGVPAACSGKDRHPALPRPPPPSSALCPLTFPHTQGPFGGRIRNKGTGSTGSVTPRKQSVASCYPTRVHTAHKLDFIFKNNTVTIGNIDGKRRKNCLETPIQG